MSEKEIEIDCDLCGSEKKALINFSTTILAVARKSVG